MSDPWTLKKFSFQRVLDEDPSTHTLVLLGTLPNSPDALDSEKTAEAIVRVERTTLSAKDAPFFFGDNGLIKKTTLEGNTDIYTWLFGWFGEAHRDSDIKITIICPATDIHIRKYTKQEQILVRETPALYEKYTKPYILGFPAARTKWVDDILSGIAEKDNLLHSSPEYLILPDMKWDNKTLNSLYLLAIVQDRTIRSLRDLRKMHVGLLKSIQHEAHRVVHDKWGLPAGSLRMYVHYQPSYYHFHVHIVNANYHGSMGMAVGQAHLLDDIISLLELDPDEGPGIFERMTITYGLGDQHTLYEPMRRALNEIS